MSDLVRRLHAEKDKHQLGFPSDKHSVAVLLYEAAVALSVTSQDVSESSDSLKELQAWVFEQRLSLLTVDPDFHVKYGVWKSVGTKIRELLSTAQDEKTINEKRKL